MKRKSLLFALLVALFMPWAANAQETVTVCDGTTTNSKIPVNGLYTDTQGTTSEFIIPADSLEVMEGGTISKVTFYISEIPGTWGSPVIQLYLGEVEGTTLSSLYGPSNFTVVKTMVWSNQQSTIEVEFDEPYTYEGGNLLIGTYVQTKGSYKTTNFYGVTGETGCSRYNNGSGTGTSQDFLPKTTFVYEPAQQGGDVCEKPATLVAENVTGNSATLTWTGGSGVYNIELNGTIIEENYEDYTYNLTDLAATTAYTAKVQSVCDGSTPTSGWKSVSFTTPCASYDIPYTYDFEAEVAFACWTPIAGVTRANSSSNAHAGSYYLRFASTTSNLVALPQFNEATNNLRVEFWTRPEGCTYSSCGTFSVGYMTDIADASTFVEVANYAYNEWTSNTHVKKTVDFNNAPANANIAFRHNALATNYFWFVDDVTVKAIPSCLAPSNLAATVSTTSAELSWTANSGETAWTVYYKKASDENYTEVANVTENPYTLTGLDAASNYEFYVVANCSADDASEPSETFTFTTACDVIPALGFSENFDSYSPASTYTPSSRELPNCWNYINECTYSSYMYYPSMSSYTPSSYAHTGYNYVKFYSSYSSYTDYDPQPQYAILPEMENLAGTQITLYAKGYNASSTFKIGTMSDPTDASTFTMIAEQTLTTSYPTDPFEYLIPADCRDNYVAIMMEPANSSNTTRGVYVDDIVIREAPTCLKPTELEATANALTATITWVSEVGEYEVAYATEATATPDENIAGTATEETYTMNDLALGDHYFWVRANCGSDGYSEWVGPVSVHIGYCVPNPTSHDGSGITGVSFGMGDYVVENGGEGTSIPASAPYYGDYSNMIGAVQAGVESTIAITTGTGSYPYTFVIWVDFDNSLSFEDNEVVYVGKASSGSGTHNATITVPATQATGDYRMRIYGADSYFNSFYGNGTINWEADHDPCSSGTYRHANDYTLRVLEAPSCMMPTDLAVNYTGGTEASISWTSDAEAWNMRVNGVDVNGVITNPYTLTGLELATTYSVEVQANCGEDGTSEWSNAVSFSTDLCMPENQCEISYNFYDQYDDSWNGAYMNIVDAATQEVLYELTMPEVDGPYEGSFNVCDGRDIQFVWVSGSYPNECGYEFTHNGEPILEKGTGETAPSAGVVLTYTVDCGFASYTLEIEGVGEENWNNENNSGYYLIASPVNVDLTNHEMTTGDFDLYYFDQEQDKEWINYKGEDGPFGLEPGKGYLYAKKATAEYPTYSFNLTGTPYSGNGVVTLRKITGAQWEGWNLVGNPFNQTAYIDRAFYTMNAAGSELEAVTSSSIEAMEGVFVVATTDGETMTFTTEDSNNDKSMLALNLSNGRNVIDRAIVRFGEGSQLPKFQLNPNHTKVYIPQDNKDYAIVNATEMGEMPVSFKAENNGSYILSINAEEVSFAYLHLIDNKTGDDVDLLATPSYSFEARTTDYANRFRLVFATGDNSNDDNFAFFSNGSFVINNEGMATVQVIDVNGRILSSESINGCANVSVNAAAGVYMIRLVNGENVKVQKVVVR